MHPRVSKRVPNRSASASDAREVSDAPGQPLDAGIAEKRFDEMFGPHRHVVLAVSGGVDSMAMLHLAAEWRAARLSSTPANTAPILSVVTVDHGLRSGSAVEAAGVCALAQRLGCEHTTLHWMDSKPVTGIQAAARAARYRLIIAHLEARGLDAVATAHTSDDQAETFLMRLARGSGVDGLAGMQACTSFGPVTLLRPMLQFSKQDLIATLKASGGTWFEDPSNEKKEFERVRLRHMRENFEAAGLSNRKIALSARRLGRARQALDEVTASYLEPAPNGLRIDALGYAELHWSWLTRLPEEIRLRILARLICAIGGSEETVPMSGLEAMTEGAGWKSPVGHTLAGAVLSAGHEPGCVVIAREYGRRIHPLPGLDLSSGQKRVWDRRFTVVNASAQARDFRVCALGAEGIAIVKAAFMKDDRPLPGQPLAALHTIPSFWEGERLAAVPLLNHFETGTQPGAVESYFSALPAPHSDRANKPFEGK